MKSMVLPTLRSVSFMENIKFVHQTIHSKRYVMFTKKALVVAAIILANIAANAQTTISHDTLTKDLSTFVKYLEETHPDPYTAFGGRVGFYRSLEEVKRSIPIQGCSAEKFGQILQAFSSTLEDGHTFVYQSSTPKRSLLQLPITVQAATDGMYISGLTEENSAFLGGKLLEIEKIPLDTILRKIGKTHPSENRYGALRAARSLIRSYSGLGAIIPLKDGKVTFTVALKNKSIRQLTLSYLADSLIKQLKMSRRPNSTGISSSKYMSYQLVGKKMDMMYFRLGSIVDRDVFAYMKQIGMSDENDQILKYTYSSCLKQKMDSNRSAAIQNIPSLTETFRNMLLEMKAKGVKSLVIDLRDNSGGFTPIVLPSLYLLWGDKFLSTQMGTQSFTRLSPLYLSKINKTLEQINEDKNTNYQMGDYIERDKEECSNDPQKRVKDFVDQYSFVQTYIDDLKVKPLYTPNQVFVVTNEGTFSAAFHYAFFLSKMGAKIVGVPSAQAPNTFMEVTEFELPRTHVKGSISNSLQQFLPANDSRAKTFTPDIPLYWEDYCNYNFDEQTELLYLQGRAVQTK
jgi:hypothetical protein